MVGIEFPLQKFQWCDYVELLFFFFEMVHLFYSVLQENCVCVQKKLFSV
jgi:hypothetical protein